MGMTGNACSAAACLLWLCLIEVQLFAAALWQQRIPNLQCYQFESSSSSLETNSHRQSILLFKTVFIQAILLAVDPLKACFVLIAVVAEHLLMDLRTSFMISSV